MQFESLYHSVFTLTSLKYGMNVYEAVEAALRRHVRQAESWESFMRHASAVRQRQDRARKRARTVARGPASRAWMRLGASRPRASAWARPAR